MLCALESETSASSAALRQKYQARLQSGELQSTSPGAIPESMTGSLQRRIVDAQRKALMDLRTRDVIGDAAFQAAEEELDLFRALLRTMGQRGLGVNIAALVTSCAVCQRLFSSLQCARRSLRSG
jgi:hypothetical protein